MNRAVWIILNTNFSITLDGEITDKSVEDKKFSPGNDIWTSEIPRLGFSDLKVQKEYDDFISDLITLFTEPQINSVLIDAKIGEESIYENGVTEPIAIRKIEEYIVDEIIK